jgi:hypothetical protein
MKKQLSWLKKIIILLGFLAILAAGFSFFVTPKAESNKKLLTQEIQEVFQKQQILAQDLNQLLQKQEFSQAKDLVPVLKENHLKLLSLHQQLDELDPDNNWQSKEEILNNNLDFFEKIETCLNFYPEQMEVFQNCQKQITQTD